MYVGSDNADHLQPFSLPARSQTECDVPVPGIPGIGNFFGGIGTNWYRKKVSEPVSVKFGTDKKSRNRYRPNLVPEKVSEPVSEKFDTGTDFRCQNL